jgi:hypothetical protein
LLVVLAVPPDHNAPHNIKDSVVINLRRGCKYLMCPLCNDYVVGSYQPRDGEKKVKNSATPCLLFDPNKPDEAPHFWDPALMDWRYWHELDEDQMFRGYYLNWPWPSYSKASTKTKYKFGQEQRKDLVCHMISKHWPQEWKVPVQLRHKASRIRRRVMFLHHNYYITAEAAESNFGSRDLLKWVNHVNVLSFLPELQEADLDSLTWDKIMEVMPSLRTSCCHHT